MIPKKSLSVGLLKIWCHFSFTNNVTFKSCYPHIPSWNFICWNWKVSEPLSCIFGTDKRNLYQKYLVSVSVSAKIGTRKRIGDSNQNIWHWEKVSVAFKILSTVTTDQAKSHHVISGHITGSSLHVLFLQKLTVSERIPLINI